MQRRFDRRMEGWLGRVDELTTTIQHWCSVAEWDRVSDVSLLLPIAPSSCAADAITRCEKKVELGRQTLGIIHPRSRKSAAIPSCGLRTSRMQSDAGGRWWATRSPVEKVENDGEGRES